MMFESQSVAVVKRNGMNGVNGHGVHVEAMPQAPAGLAKPVVIDLACDEADKAGNGMPAANSASSAETAEAAPALPGMARTKSGKPGPSKEDMLAAFRALRAARAAHDELELAIAHIVEACGPGSLTNDLMRQE